jgi:hypothetical protein
MAKPGPIRLVAVDGPGGAGKSTFARALSEAAGGAPVIHTDDFAADDERSRRTDSSEWRRARSSEPAGRSHMVSRRSRTNPIDSYTPCPSSLAMSTAGSSGAARVAAHVSASPIPRRRNSDGSTPTRRRSRHGRHARRTSPPRRPRRGRRTVGSTHRALASRQLRTTPHPASGRRPRASDELCQVCFVRHLVDRQPVGNRRRSTARRSVHQRWVPHQREAERAEVRRRERRQHDDVALRRVPRERLGERVVQIDVARRLQQDHGIVEHHG